MTPARTHPLKTSIADVMRNNKSSLNGFNALWFASCLDMEKGKKYDYIELPYRLGLITATAPNAISAMCKK